MGYVEKNLMPGETVVYRARISWLIYATPLALLAFSIVVAGAGLPVLALLMVPFFLATLVTSAFTKHTTELAVTNKRLIAKFGFIRRNTVEMYLSKVESLRVDQGVIDRLLSAGTITVHGAGGGNTPIPCIDDPLEFRRQAMALIDPQQ